MLIAARSAFSLVGIGAAGSPRHFPLIGVKRVPTSGRAITCRAYTEERQPSRTFIVSLLPALVMVTSSMVVALSPDEMEEAYWDCEYEATEGIIDLNAAAACSEIYETLKSTKFRGDFKLMLLWWNENKERELSKRKKVVSPPRGY